MKKIITLFTFFSIAFYLKAQEVKIPKFNSDQEKENWINSNQENYNEILNQKKLIEREKNNVTEYIIINGIKVEKPEFPKYVNTGNKQADDLDFERRKNDYYAKIAAINESNKIFMQSEEEKEKWIHENKNLYHNK